MCSNKGDLYILIHHFIGVRALSGNNKLGIIVVKSGETKMREGTRV